MEEIICDTLYSYASERKVVSLLSKFRIRYEMKLREARDGERNDPRIDPELDSLMPSSYRVGNGSSNSLQQSLSNYLIHRLDEFRSGTFSEPYVVALSEFISKIRKVAKNGEFTFSKPQIIPKLKERTETEEGEIIVYRPLSAYTDLTTKVVVTLVSDWFSDTFDKYFHYEMLAYRRPREYHGKVKVTSNKDAVATIEEYRQCHADENIYVAECDIQKFFDIISHPVVLECFDRMVDIAHKDRPSLDMSSARRLLESFLDSYSFFQDIWAKNSDDEFWRNSLGKAYDPDASHEFKWISLSSAKKLDPLFEMNLGIPQGAALSTILTNIVLSSVDEPILSEEDHDRFFVRFCDDILLMHTDYNKCCILSDIYARSLKKHGLEYHPFKDVSRLVNGSRIQFPGIVYDEGDSYWHAKSKRPFLWGKSPLDPNSAFWIGFLGFEFSRDGEVRMRRSSVGKKVDKMLQDYNQIRYGKEEELRNRHLERFRSMKIEIPEEGAEGHNLLSSHSGITDNSYTRHQIELLRKFRKRYSDKLD